MEQKIYLYQVRFFMTCNGLSLHKIAVSFMRSKFVAPGAVFIQALLRNQRTILMNEYNYITWFVIICIRILQVYFCYLLVRINKMYE